MVGRVLPPLRGPASLKGALCADILFCRQTITQPAVSAKGSQMAVLIVLIVVLLVLLAVIRSPRFKGGLGELTAHAGMKLFLDGNSYHIIRNVTLPTGKGSTQIDHVVVSRFGIFVIETKTMNGAIYGGENDRQWTQAMGGRKFRFMNPLRQNYKHTRTLAELLGVPHEKMISIVMLIGDGELKTRDRLPPNVLTSDLAGFIKSYRVLVFTEEEVSGILSTIEAKRLAPGWKTTRQHVAHVRDIKTRAVTAQAPGPVPLLEPASEADPSAPVPPTAQTPSQAAPSPICSKCGKPMILRTAKRGQHVGRKFWGCSGFPSCRHILPWRE